MRLFTMDVSRLDPDDARWAERVPAERLARARGFRNAAARAQSLGVGILLDEVLRRHFPEVARPAETACGAKGKPHLAGAPGLAVSWAHAGSLVALGIGAAAEGPAGVDAERFGRARAAVAARYFHPEETAWLAAQPEERRDEAFTRLWTLKEAFTKALGEGLSLGLSRFAVRFRGEEPEPVEWEGRRWRLRSWRLEGGYAAALCAPEGAAFPDAPESVALPVAE